MPRVTVRDLSGCAHAYQAAGWRAKTPRTELRIGWRSVLSVGIVLGRSMCCNVASLQWSIVGHSDEIRRTRLIRAARSYGGAPMRLAEFRHVNGFTATGHGWADYRNDGPPAFEDRHLQIRVASRLLCLAILFAVTAAIVPVRCFAQPPDVGRPILFVHGWCGDPNWGAIQENVTSYVINQKPSLYKDLKVHPLYYDRSVNAVRVFPSGELFATSTSVDSRARFFSIAFYTPGAFGSDGSIDRSAVAGVSVFNKADELAQAIQGITTLTHVQDVIVIAHSMGGLVTRAYMQGFAIQSSSQCTDGDAYGSCLSGPYTYFAKDAAKLITLDTPHIGADTSSVANLPGANILKECTDTLNSRELQHSPSSLVAFLLNNDVGTLPSGVPITAIRSYTVPGLIPFSLADDGVVRKDEQGITTFVPSSSRYYDLDNVIPGNPLTTGLFLHLLENLGAYESTSSYIETEAGPAPA